MQLCNENPLLDPKGALMSIHWITSMTTRLQTLSTDAESVKDGLIFFDRSPITPHVCVSLSLSLSLSLRCEVAIQPAAKLSLFLGCRTFTDSISGDLYRSVACLRCHIVSRRSVRWGIGDDALERTN